MNQDISQKGNSELFRTNKRMQRKKKSNANFTCNNVRTLSLMVCCIRCDLKVYPFIMNCKLISSGSMLLWQLLNQSIITSESIDNEILRAAKIYHMVCLAQWLSYHHIWMPGFEPQLLHPFKFPANVNP